MAEGKQQQMQERERRTRRCCFTGHRPENLSFSEQETMDALEREIKKAVEDGFDVFISGMARGVDIWAAECVLRQKERGEPIKLVCAVPFEGFDRAWSASWKQRYHRVLSKADHVQFIGRGYTRSCFQERNKWMVDHSLRVIAVFEGGKGGTKNTLDYAARQGVEVRLCRCGRTLLDD